MAYCHAVCRSHKSLHRQLLVSQQRRSTPRIYTSPVYEVYRAFKAPTLLALTASCPSPPYALVYPEPVNGCPGNLPPAAETEGSLESPATTRCGPNPPGKEGVPVPGGIKLRNCSPTALATDANAASRTPSANVRSVSLVVVGGTGVPSMLAVLTTAPGTSTVGSLPRATRRGKLAATNRGQTRRSCIACRRRAITSCSSLGMSVGPHVSIVSLIKAEDRRTL